MVNRGPRGMGEASFLLAPVPKHQSPSTTALLAPGLGWVKMGGIPQCDQVEFLWLEKTIGTAPIQDCRGIHVLQDPGPVAVQPYIPSGMRYYLALFTFGQFGL